MLLTITTTHRPATDLGYLLHKHPGRLQSFPQSSGVAHVFYPQADDDRCTVALLLEVDPVALVRGRREGDTGFPLGRYVNDRPYAASSLLAVALKSVFTTAAAGVCRQRPELVEVPLPLEIGLPALPVGTVPGSTVPGPAASPDAAPSLDAASSPDTDPRSPAAAALVERLFAPLGWAVDAVAHPVDPQVPQWGDAPVVTVTLRGTVRLADALHQLYVLLPVLDGGQHYWVADAEVDKLVRAGSGWLAGHPERELITHRYLAGQRDLTRDARERLGPPTRGAADRGESDQADGADLARLLDDAASPATVDHGPVDHGPVGPESPAVVERDRISLRQHRHAAVLEAVRSLRPRVVGDLGCGSGALVADLVALPGVQQVVATDVSAGALAALARRLHLDEPADGPGAPRLPDAGTYSTDPYSGGDGGRTGGPGERIRVFQSALTYRDPRLAGLDVAVLMEVVEHIDPDRLPAVERSVFGDAAPGAVVITTPNVEYNVRYPRLPAGDRRHPDHRFEWTRDEFAAWTERVAATYGYTVRRRPVGEVDPQVGAPTQLAVFTREVNR